MIPKDVIEKIHSTAKIEEVVADYVTLRKRGANLIGLCPFHNEKTGSFTVSPSKGIYKCFGCGAVGNAVGFIMEIEQCSYVEALKILGKKYHIEVPEREMTAEEQQRQDDRESMFVVNDFANKWFQDQLWNTQEGQAIGLSYFHERGLRDDIIRKFQLGYSPEKGSPLAQALKKKGFKEKFILNDVDTKIGVGIVGKSEDGRVYDRFRDRVMFPIFTVSGKPVAFAGRILKKKDNVGKYINSPDSIIYSKTNELYGLFQAKQAISRADMCYLVEGQLDVISMYQSGIENVVASGGTALTKPQIWLIKRFTSNITVLYDGDAAGIHAALRGIDMFLEAGFNVKVVLLPDGEDPDSYAQSHDSTEFIRYIEEHKTDFIRFKTKLLSKDAGDDPFKRAELIKDITATIAIIPDIITRQVYIKDCAERLNMSEKVLTVEVMKLRKEKVQNNPNYPDTPSTPKNPITSIKPKTPMEQNYYNLMRLVVRYGERPIMVGGETYTIGEVIIGSLENDEIQPPQPIYQTLIDEFKQHYKDTGFKAETFFKFHADPNVSALAVDMIADKYRFVQSDEEKRLGEVVTRQVYEIKLTVVNMQIADLEQNLKAAQESGDIKRQFELLQHQPALLNMRNELCRILGNRVINV